MKANKSEIKNPKSAILNSLPITIGTAIQKHQVHNLIILDESGSMESIKKNIISGFNEIVQTVKGIEKEYPEQEHFISMVTFNGLGQKTLHFTDAVSKLEMIDDSRYQPDANTPLYDAIGFSCTKLRNSLGKSKNFNVLVTILTDGEENASTEYNGPAVKRLIEELKNNNWTFTYIGTDHDVEKSAASMSITNTISFSKDVEGIKAMIMKEGKARSKFSMNIREKKATMDGFYDEDVKI